VGSQDHRGHHKQRSYAGKDTRRQTEREAWRMMVAGNGDGWMDGWNGMGWVVVMVTVVVAVAVVVLMTIKSNST
jgi:hypothetical protein